MTYFELWPANAAGFNARPSPQKRISYYRRQLRAALSLPPSFLGVGTDPPKTGQPYIAIRHTSTTSNKSLAQSCGPVREDRERACAGIFHAADEEEFRVHRLSHTVDRDFAFYKEELRLTHGRRLHRKC